MNLSCIKRTVRYELEYLNQKFRLYQALYPILSLISAFFVNSDSVQTFFSQAHPLMPKDWIFPKSSNHSLILSTLIITVPSLVLFISNSKAKSKEINDLSEAVEEGVIPHLEKDLNSLKGLLKRKYNFDSPRLSIFVPTRKGLLQWRFQMVCRTKNIKSRELEASLGLDEGVVGHIFLNTLNQHYIKFVDLSSSKPHPIMYKPLSKSNKLLINQDIKGIIGTPAVQKGFISGILAIDTNNLQHLPVMETLELQDFILEWILRKEPVIKLLWKWKNNV